MLLLAHWRGRKYRVLFALPCLAFGHLTHRTEKYTLRKRKKRAENKKRYKDIY